MDEDALNDSINREVFQFHNTEPQGFIYRVAEPLRSVNRKSYEPDILAIGPYHHGKVKYKMMEEHKRRYLRSILTRNGENTAKRYISVVSESEEEARSCYAEPVNLCKDKFIKMLVLDGCFIIELALKQNYPDYRYKNDPIFSADLIGCSLTRDMILFENQIPFFILCKLFDLIMRPGQYDMLIYLLLSSFDYLIPDRHYEIVNNRSPSDVKHLLDLIYHSWTPESFDGADLNIDYPIRQEAEAEFIPSVTELKNANVGFKKRDDCNHLFEVIFRNGTLHIPPLNVSDGTEFFLRNLLAYEQYFQHEGSSYVGAYVNFMDLLINSSKDVDALTKCGIIVNSVGDNEVIARMFNKLMRSVMWSPDHAYRQTFKDINKYHSKVWNSAIAVLNRDYFSSPWGFISIFAAFVLLILTFIQALCSIFQVV